MYVNTCDRFEKKRNTFFWHTQSRIDTYPVAEMQLKTRIDRNIRRVGTYAAHYMHENHAHIK